MSTATTEKLLTADEFFDFTMRPENANGWFELVRGKVIELPAPTKRHGVICCNVGFELQTYARQRRKGYVTSNDSGVLLERDPDTVRGPDVALYEDARTFAELHPKYGEVAPRLAVEVLSPSDRADRITLKLTDYLRNGVPLVWIVDPEIRTVTVYRPDQGPEVVREQEELIGGGILPGLRCRVADLFFMPGEPASPTP